ncbi:hypothetical protein F0562_029404 [Nyssa sinensis]|uniref:Uncharacterized protein n=1 Tax=Nyssa sinensis TaxID=561372 RepID=A0A5J5B3Z1_9ASTE|nr:hypothetical protein F0562_029404 [Nyssa sinensis]
MGDDGYDAGDGSAMVMVWTDLMGVGGLGVRVCGGLWSAVGGRGAAGADLMGVMEMCGGDDGLARQWLVVEDCGLGVLDGAAGGDGRLWLWSAMMEMMGSDERLRVDERLRFSDQGCDDGATVNGVGNFVGSVDSQSRDATDRIVASGAAAGGMNVAVLWGSPILPAVSVQKFGIG